MNDNKKSLVSKKDDREQALARDREQLLNLPPEKALDLLAEHPYPVTLIQSMARDDFYYLVHAIGPDEAKPVLAVASNDQWQYLMDMETWDRDSIAPHGVTLWLERLLKADSDRFTHWITSEKRDDFILYLFKNVQLHIREYEQDPGEIEQDFFSEDQTYYIRLRPYAPDQKMAQEQRDRFLTDLLKRISIFDFTLYRDMLLAADSIVPAEVEEESYRLRTVRLAEMGFLPFDEAVGVYQPLTAADLTQRPPKIADLHKTRAAEFPLPVDIHQPAPDANRFARTLSRIQDTAELQRLQAEFARLCNQVIAADQQHVREKEILAKVVQKVGDYISIGLEKVSAEENQETPYSDDILIQTYLLADIFRVGYGCALALKWKTEKWQRSSWFTTAGLPVSFWGERWLGVLGGLLIKKPLFFDNYASGVLYREFSVLDDITNSETVLNQIIAFDDLLSLMNIDPGVAPPHVLLTYQNLMLTLWANHYLGVETKADRPMPLPLEGFRQLFGEMMEGAKPPRRISSTMREVFLGWLADRSGLTDYEISERMAPALEQMFAAVEEELGMVEPGDLDPRYIRQFIIQSQDQ